MPPSIFERLINILGSSPDMHTHPHDAQGWGHSHALAQEGEEEEEEEGGDGKEVGGGRRGHLSPRQKPTNTLTNDEEEEEGGNNTRPHASSASATAARGKEAAGAAAGAGAGEGQGGGKDYFFSDQDGRVLRGDSRATSLDICRPPPTHARAFSWMTDLGDSPLSLNDLVQVLPTVLERCNTRNMKKCEPVKRLLSRLELRREEWAPFAFWDPEKLYTRNLVATDGKTFTLLLLCWNPGKESPIHDHPCEGCWVKSVQGTVKETIYQLDPVQGLVPEQENFFHPGELSYIEDSLGYHKVANPDPKLGAVTLHCYIPPPKSARVWLGGNTGAADAMTVPTCLYSAFGKRVKEGGVGVGGTIMNPTIPGAGEVAGSPGAAGQQGCCLLEKEKEEQEQDVL